MAIDSKYNLVGRVAARAWDDLFSVDAWEAASNTIFEPPYDSSRLAPEGGARLLRAFLRIGQPALREAIIELVARMTEADESSSSAQRTA
jgi:hypothetical protein